MTNQKTRLTKLAAGTALLLAAQAAIAQTSMLDKVSLRVGATTIKPDVKSGNLSPPSLVGTKIDIKPASQLSGGISYALSEQWAIDLPLGLAFEHEVVGDGAIAGVGKLGDVKALPITLLLQYRFGTPGDRLRPYVGAGGTYARFFKGKGTAALSGLTGGTPANPTSLSMDNAFGATVQAGLELNFSKQWFLDVSATYVKLKSTGHLTTGQKIDVRLDPTAFSLAVGYRF